MELRRAGRAPMGVVQVVGWMGLVSIRDMERSYLVVQQLGTCKQLYYLI